MSPSAVDNASSILTDSLRRLQLKEQIPSSLTEPAKRQNGAHLADESDSSSGGEGEGESLRALNSSPPSPGTLQKQMHKNVYEGYGFRPASGVATPLNPPPAGTSSPLPDPNGLGWPGEFLPSPFSILWG